MKKIISNKITTIVLLVVSVAFFGFYTYMLARPISYGMDYHNVTVYDGGVFEGTMKFKVDKTMFNSNTNFNEELKSFYYYKSGYIFFTMAENSEDYQEEVAYINDNFDQAIATPFYADKINAFRLVLEEDDGYSTTYTCKSAIVLAIVGGVVELVLISFAVASAISYKNTIKTKKKK